MKAFHEDEGDVLALKIVTVVLGFAFVLGGIGLVVTGDWQLGAPMMLIGCYVAAASLVALRDGEAAWDIFAPAAASALMAIVGLSLASGAIPA
jgi:hypothetical protein